jgi:hypothetical protein
MSDEKDTRAASGVKFSQFKQVGPQEGNPVQVVGLRDGENVRASLTTDLVETNPDITFRNAKGQFAAVDPGIMALTNQLQVNRYFYERLLELGVTIGEEAPGGGTPADGGLWFDNSEDVMQLFIFHKDSDAWIPVAPPTTLEGRVSTGEATQDAIIAQIEESLEEQENIKSKIKALEGAVGEHSLIFTSDQQNPRDGQFNLKDQAYQLVNSLSEARYITLNETDRNGNPIDLSRIVVGDVLRLSDISAQTAELKVIAVAENVYDFEYLSGELDRLSEYPYDFFLLSSFDPAGLATIDYVDSKANRNKEHIDALQLDVGYRMHATWKYMGDSHQAENLNNGEFTIRTEGGGNPILKIYLSGKDTHGRKWYAWSDDEGYFSHAFGSHYCSITDRDGETRKAGKLTEGTFNNSGNQYVRLKCEYYKSNWQLSVGNYYTINAAGLLPHAHYIDHYEHNQAPRTVAQASMKEKETSDVVIGSPMEGEE